MGFCMHQIATDIGSRLRHAREKRGLTIRDIANITKISTAALDAIEHNDFARLPGGLFGRAYVRAFAVEVGLNADELSREYRDCVEAAVSACPLLVHETDSGDRARTLRWLVAVFIIGGGLLIGGLLISNTAHSPQQPSGEGPLVVVAGAGLSERTASAGQPKEADVALAKAIVAEADTMPLQLEIQLHGPCWVSAVADGERVVYRLMQPGERTWVEARNTITLRVGDAGAVTYAINGTAGRPLGRDGEAVTVDIGRDSDGSLYAEPAASHQGASRRVWSGTARGTVERTPV
jgi:cytoskeletal protein RodZ